MRIRFVLVLISSFIINDASAQELSDVLTPSGARVTWLGVDFSHVQAIGGVNSLADWGEKGPEQLASFYFNEWNQLFIAEQGKYSVRDMLQRRQLVNNLKPVQAINEAADVDAMSPNRPIEYTREEIQEFLDEYDFGGGSGVGILFIAESMNKAKAEAAYHFVAIRLSDNSIILHEVFDTDAGGAGFYNYWARSIYEVVYQIKKKRYKEWKKEYGF
ncbi:MAG: hypothetical protein QNK23_00630 [Crocinitomicaceae bacterium]|nr:hypothetical protein [Crocinitomicaceae bacterium]